MLLVDDRVGSNDLLEPLKKYGVPAYLQRLSFADFAFVGRGVGGRDLTIGVELKEPKDLIASLNTGRLAGHQLQGLLDSYDRVWLLTEGITRTQSGGVLEVMQGGWRGLKVGGQAIMTRTLEKQLLTLQIRGGIYHKHCPTRNDTILWLSALYHWWTDKDLDEHGTHLAFHQHDLDRQVLIAPNLCRKIAKELPKVGWTKSEAASEHFNGNVRRMINAGVNQWTEIAGIGAGIATQIVEAVNRDE